MKRKEIILNTIDEKIGPESTTINRDEEGNVTSIVKESKTMTINYENGEVVSFTDNEYLWEIIKTDGLVTGVTVTKL